MKKTYLPILVFVCAGLSGFAQNGMGIGNNNPQEILDVTGAIKIGTDLNNNTGAPSGAAGTIRFRSNVFEGWDGTEWLNLGTEMDADWTVNANDQYSALSGNVGIGTTSPAHKLHVSGTGHTGIGVNSGTGVNTYLDFAENGTLRSNIYWNGADDVFVLNSIGANTSINNNGGNVGVGTAAPAYKLHVQTTSSGVDFPLFVRNTSLTSGDGAGIGFVSEPNGNWVKSGIFHERTSVFGIGKLHLLVNNNGDNSSATMVDSRLTIQPDGNVGIGTTGPAAKLDVVGGNVALNNGQLRLRDGADGNHFLQYSNFNGTDGPELVGLSSVKLRQISGGSVGQLVLRNNRVGINTDNPTRGLLEVNGYYNNDANGFYYYANGVCCNSGSGSVDVSIYASRRVQASEFNAFSDARIKNIVGLSNGSEDLKSIMGIEITEYTKIDQAANKGIEKKVIAQQVETVFPQAVSRATDFIPNISSILFILIFFG
ncbi:MAG: tail fiber domain-containing protein, partial [Flavobacteriales bacterium]